MIDVVRKGALTKVVAVERQGVINLGVIEHHESGNVPYQPLDIVFYEGKGGVMRSNSYAIGLGRAHGRKIHATPLELRVAFAKAGIAVRIVTRQELLASRKAVTAAKGDAPSLAA